MWKREAPLANPTGPTRQFDSDIYYDSSDQLKSVVNKALPGSSVETLGHHYTYDKAGNLGSKQLETSVSGSNMTTYTHNPMNQITGISGAGGTQIVRLRGQTNEPATVKVKPASSAIWKDARLLSENRFEADLGLGTGSNPINIQAKDGSNNVSNYTYGLNLAAATSASLSYDADGNILTDGIRSYVWDSQSRLVKVSWGSSSNKSTEFLYNSLGQRSEQIEKTASTETAHYYLAYDGIQRIARFNGGTATSNLDHQYFSQGERRKISGSWDSFYYTRDHLGSIREVVKTDGTLAARYDYDPYGKRLPRYESTAYGTCPFGFTGHLTQNSAIAGGSELVLTHFRAYDPEMGRWLSADPIERVTGELAELLPRSSNLYGYVVNDPINRWDPLGLVDSVDTGITSMMFKGDIEGLKMVLQGLEGAQAQTCRMAIEKASQPVVKLIKGSLKRSKSYDTGLENHTIQELAQLAREGSVKAAKMLKLLKNEGRILDKCKG